MPTTNNVIRLLLSRKISFTTFDLPVEKLGALETARILNIPSNQVFKTIVIVREYPKKPILSVIPGDSEADLKKVAHALGEKKVRLATQKEAEALTGLEVGGISPLALLHRGFTILLDQSANQFSEIHISGGQRGLNIRLPVNSLIELTNARLADLKTMPEDSI